MNISPWYLIGHGLLCLFVVLAVPWAERRIKDAVWNARAGEAMAGTQRELRAIRWGTGGLMAAFVLLYFAVKRTSPEGLTMVLGMAYSAVLVLTGW